MYGDDLKTTEIQHVNYIATEECECEVHRHRRKGSQHVKVGYIASVFAHSGDKIVDCPAITAKPADFQLSQEESGLSIIIQDVAKDSECMVQFELEKVCLTNL